MKLLRVGALLLGATATSFAAGTQSWEMTSWQDFLRGKFSGVGLTREGRIILAPAWTTIFNDGQSAVWCATRTPDGQVWLGTGHKGRVARLDGKNWTLPEPEIFAITSDAKGTIYAATSPNGKIYKIENGAVSEYFNPNEKYIWSLTVAPDGTLYVGTGEDGKIYAVKSAGRGELYFDSSQMHITALAIDAGGALLAGSDPNGILYRISGKEKAFVVYDANFPEIRSIVPMPDGRIYMAALGGSVAKRTAASPITATTPAVTVTAPTTSITVEAQAGLDVKPKPDAPKPQVQQPVAVSSTILEVSGVEKSAIFRIAPDGTVESLWTSKEENAYDLIASNNALVFSTDGPGRIYNLSDDRKVTLIDQTNQNEVVRLFSAPKGLMAVTSNPGELRQQQDRAVLGGVYESPVHDAGSISRWGRLDWHGTGKLVFRTRAGNSARPDKTWSDWSAPLTVPSTTGSPSARFIQWKADLSDAGSIDSVNLSYRPQNNAPQVKTISVVSQLVASPASSKPAAATPSGAAYTITVTDTGDSGASSLSGTSTQNAGRAGMRQLVITWTSEDLDNDVLSYNLSFRGEDEREWKPLKTNFSEQSFSLDGDALADGRYFFRVVVSDRASNPTIDAREGELISAPVRIDNSPPQVTLRREGNDVLVHATDAASSLRKCEVSIDARPWIVVEAEDGITDGPEENFRVRLNSLSPGEHLLTVRVVDSAGNPGLAKLILR